MYAGEDQFDEYKLPGDEPAKKIKFSSEKPDTTEYMVREVKSSEIRNPRVKDLHEYYNSGGYQYGPRKKKK